MRVYFIMDASLACERSVGHRGKSSPRLAPGTLFCLRSGSMRRLGLQGYFYRAVTLPRDLQGWNCCSFVVKWKKKRYDPFATSLTIICSSPRRCTGYMRFPRSSLIRFVHDIFAKNSNSLEESPPL